MLNRIKQELAQGKTLLQFGSLKATGQVLGMVAPLVVAKFFSPALFGSYSLAMMVVFFFASLLFAFAQTPFIVFANQERAKTGKISKSFSVQCIFLVFSIIGFLLINLFCSKAIMAFAKISLTDLLFMSLAFIGLALKTFLCNLFMAMGQRIKNSIAELIFGSSVLVLVSALCLTDNINMTTVFLTYFASGSLVVILFIKTIDFSLLLPICFDKQHFKEMVNFAKWLLLGTTSAYFIGWGDNLVLRLFAPMGDIGTYNLGYQLFKGIGMLTFIIYVYFLPFVSQHIEDSAKMRNYLFNKRPKIFLVGLVVIGLFFVAVPYAFKFIYKGVYQDSVTVLWILLIGSVSRLYVIFYDPILNALKKYKFAQTVTLLQLLLNLFLDLLLVPVMGIYGAAVATVIAYFCRTIIYEIYFRKRIRGLFEI